MKKTIEGYIARVNQRLETALPAAEGPTERLFSAMRYSVFNGGKRLRPLFVLPQLTPLVNPIKRQDLSRHP